VYGLGNNECFLHGVGEKCVESFEILARIDDLDDDRQILREGENLRGMKVTVRAEAEHAFQDRGTGESESARLVDDGLVEGAPW
jgi:hypothetical protein